MTVSRAEHLTWCKARALEYLDEGDLTNAVASMMSDLGKHPDFTVSPALVQLGVFYIAHDDEAGVRHWIEGFR
jgi:hypothetical protein